MFEQRINPINRDREPNYYSPLSKVAVPLICAAGAVFVSRLCTADVATGEKTLCFWVRGNSREGIVHSLDTAVSLAEGVQDAVKAQYDHQTQTTRLLDQNGVKVGRDLTGSRYS